MSLGVADYDAADIAREGSWRLTPRSGSKSIARLGLAYPPASNASRHISLEELGVSLEVLSDDGHAVHFELARESGRFECDGAVSDGSALGRFRFEPAASYAGIFVECGLPALTVRDHVLAGVFNISSAFVRSVGAAGFPSPTFSQLLTLATFEIDPKEIAALRARFPSEHFGELRGLVQLGATADYFDALDRAGVRDGSPTNVIAMRAIGVDRAFVECLISQGRLGLTVDDVVRLYRADLGTSRP